MKCRNFCQVAIIILMLITSIKSGLARDKSPFIDPKMVSGEKNTYEVVENGRVFKTTHIISREQYNGKDIYIVNTDTYQMILEASDLRPILIEKMNSDSEPKFQIKYDSEVEFYIKYTDDRVHFIYPGSKRNKVEKIPEDRYDLNTILEVVRGFPFGQEKVKFTLVTSEHIVGAYIKIVDNERITVPAGTFDCYKLEGGISGLIGKILGKKFFFWVEKTYPYRVIKHTDSSGERLMKLVSCEILK